LNGVDVSTYQLSITAHMTFGGSVSASIWN
jgi:hypothetical protein